MPDQEQLDEFHGAPEALEGHSGNGKLRALLDWDEATHDAVKAELVAKGFLVTGRGRGALLRWLGQPRHPHEGPSGQSTPQRNMKAASAPVGPQPTGKQHPGRHGSAAA